MPFLWSKIYHVHFLMRTFLCLYVSLSWVLVTAKIISWKDLEVIYPCFLRTEREWLVAQRAKLTLMFPHLLHQTGSLICICMICMINIPIQWASLHVSHLISRDTLWSHIFFCRWQSQCPAFFWDQVSTLFPASTIDLTCLLPWCREQKETHHLCPSSVLLWTILPQTHHQNVSTYQLFFVRKLFASEHYIYNCLHKSSCQALWSRMWIVVLSWLALKPLVMSSLFLQWVLNLHLLSRRTGNQDHSFFFDLPCYLFQIYICCSSQLKTRASV